MTTYQFELNKIQIKTEDSFDICKEFDGIININLTEYTESDKLWLDQFEFDYSYQFDLYVNEAEINLRQKDFTNFMKCVDLNVTYTDEKDALYDYEMNKLNLKKMKTNNPQHQKENIRTEKEILKLKKKYEVTDEELDFIKQQISTANSTEEAISSANEKLDSLQGESEATIELQGGISNEY